MLRDDIINDLTVELGSEPTFDADILAVKVDNAIREVKRRRNYKASNMSNEEIEEDLENYYTNIHNVALFDYNQIGDEFQSAMTENGTRREYVDREKLFVGVAAFQQAMK